MKAKERILRGAFQLLLDNDFRKVNLVDLERVTGLTRGSIFYHYKDMDDVMYNTVHNYLYGIQDDARNANFHKSKSFYEFLFNYVDMIAGYSGKIREITLLVLQFYPQGKCLLS